MAEQKSKTPRGSIVQKCTCEHDFQDEKYGKGMRLKNMCVKGARCTICEKISDMK